MATTLTGMMGEEQWSAMRRPRDRKRRRERKEVCDLRFGEIYVQCDETCDWMNTCRDPMEEIANGFIIVDNFDMNSFDTFLLNQKILNRHGH